MTKAPLHSTDETAKRGWWRPPTAIVASLLVSVGMMAFTPDPWKRALLGLVLAAIGIVLVFTLTRRVTADPNDASLSGMAIAIPLLVINDVGQRFLTRGLWPVPVAAVALETALLTWAFLRRNEEG